MKVAGLISCIAGLVMAVGSLLGSELKLIPIAMTFICVGMMLGNSRNSKDLQATTPIADTTAAEKKQKALAKLSEEDKIALGV